VGIQWVLHYYYRGVTSWSWYFPHHYAPMMSDLVDLESVQLDFSMGRPFRPFEQLLAVLPPASMKHLPEAFHVRESLSLSLGSWAPLSFLRRSR
jgi:5'-3' exonuclease